MKKLLFTLSCICPLLSFGQIFQEDFQGATFPPVGWTIQRSNITETWEAFTYTSGNIAASVEYDALLAPQNEWLISPTINLSTATTAFLEFNTTLSYYWSVAPNNNYDVFAKVSTDGGTTWTQVWSETQLGVFTNFASIPVSISLAPYVGNANVKVAFQYVGTDGAQFTVDNVAVRAQATPPPTPPANDACAGAVLLTPGANFDSHPVTGTTVLATNSTTLPTCSATSAVSDVWYRVAIPASGSLTIQTGGAPDSENEDTILGVFSGSCTALASIDCNDDNPDDEDSLFSKVTITGRIPGEIVYIGVWQYSGVFGPAIPGEFVISAFDASLSTGSFEKQALSFYPNPVKDILNISYGEKIESVAIYNIMGQEVLNKTLGNNEGQVDVSGLSSGTYLAKVKADTGIKTIKIVKQ